jgi:electron transport complex protein RnfC
MAETRTVQPFHGGLHLDDHKAESTGRPVRDVPLPDELVLPLQQHIGQPAECLVQVGDPVLTGQVVAQAGDYVSAAVHAPTSGQVVAIEERPIAHPSGMSATCLVIRPDGKDTWAPMPEPLTDYRHHSVSELRERIRWAGIVGLGGAAFPTAVKVNTTGGWAIDTLIINAAECEPYITCDDTLMRERPADIVDGIGILQYLVSAGECLIGIEDNKPEAAAALQAALDAQNSVKAEIVVVPSVYPSGGEKQLIKLLTGREVPSHRLPSAVGVLCQNVATTAAIADAVLRGRPLIERLVTATGRGVREPGNFRVRLGTPAEAVIAAAGGYSDTVQRLILGGPMMGFALHSDRVPMTKGGNCLLATADAAPDPSDERPCIRCGECARVCPAQLLPQQLYWHARARDFDKVQDFHLFDCIECGCCAYVCPAHIPLVHYYRYAKTEIWAQEREREKSDLARRRHQAREERLARLEAERKARLRQKKEALEKQPAESGVDPKKAAIEAAMKRVAAKKAAQQVGADAEPGD